MAEILKRFEEQLTVAEERMKQQEKTIKDLSQQLAKQKQFFKIKELSSKKKEAGTPHIRTDR